MNCRKCNSEYILKHGRTRSGKQNFKCRDCGRQFVMTPRHQPISEVTIMVDRSTFIRKDISGWDCEGDWGFGTVVAILC